MIHFNECGKMAAIKCPNCGKINDDSLDFCIYCGAIYADYMVENQELPNLLIFKMNEEGKAEQVDSSFISPDMPPRPAKQENHTIAIVIGYILAILGGFLGFIFAIYLITRKDPNAKRHGLVQLIILLVEYIFMAYMFMSGQIDASLLLNPFNMTGFSNMSQINGSTNMSSLFGI